MASLPPDPVPSDQTAANTPLPRFTPEQRKARRWKNEKAKMFSEFFREAAVLMIVFGAVMLERPHVTKGGLPAWLLAEDGVVLPVPWAILMVVLTGLSLWAGFAIEKLRH